MARESLSIRDLGGQPGRHGCTRHPQPVGQGRAKRARRPREEEFMMGHDRRRYGRANAKARIGIAAAVLAGGGAIAAVAVASSHGASPAAQTAGYSARYSSTGGGSWSLLNTAMSNLGRSTQTSYNALTSLGQSTYMQATQHNRTFVEQRGAVVLATNKFIILQSANG